MSPLVLLLAVSGKIVEALGQMALGQTALGQTVAAPWHVLWLGRLVPGLFELVLGVWGRRERMAFCRGKVTFDGEGMICGVARMTLDRGKVTFECVRRTCGCETMIFVCEMNYGRMRRVCGLRGIARDPGRMICDLGRRICDYQGMIYDRKGMIYGRGGMIRRRQRMLYCRELHEIDHSPC